MNLLKGLVGGFLLGATLPFLICLGMRLFYDFPPGAIIVVVWVLTPPSAIVSCVLLGLAGAARDRSDVSPPDDRPRQDAPIIPEPPPRSRRGPFRPGRS